MNLKELRAKQAQLVVEARERLDQVTKETDESRAKELETQHDAAMAEYDRLEKRGEQLEKLQAAEQRVRDANRDRRPNNDTDGGEDRGEAGEISYRSVFAKIVCGAAPGDLEPEERAVLKNGMAKLGTTAAEKRIQTAGTTTAGGFVVPTELAGWIDRAMKDWGPMYDSDVARVIPTARGNPFKIPTVDDTAKSAAAHTEGTALTDDGSEDIVLAQKSLDGYTFDTEFIKWSFELESDSDFSFEELLGDLLGERLGRIANAQLTTGTGSSAPQGVVGASSLGKTATSATALTADELIDLEHSVNQAYRRSPKCRWMFRDSTFAAIRKLKDGQGNYLWQQGNVTAGAPPTFNGRLYSINDDMAAIATGAKTVLFGDFGRYYVRKVGSPIIGVVRERFWPDLGIAGLIRFDGELGQSGAIKHLIQA